MLTNKNLLPPLSLDQKIDLSNHKYLIKNIIYISNLTNDLYNKDILYQKKFFGQYGHIGQIFFDKNNQKQNSVIIKFDTVNQAALAILALDNFELNNGFKIKIMYYLTKFCNHFLNNKECLNQNCLFIHTANINEYQYERITNPNQLNSFQFALDVLNIPKPIFDVIYMKLIGDNFYENQKKFPKMTMKKLKNEEFINSILSYIKENQKNNKGNNNIKKPPKKKFENKNTHKKYNKNKYKNSKRDSFHSFDSNNEKISTSEESVEKNYEFIYNNNIIFKRKKNSRFDFVKKNNNDNEIIIPEFILDFIDKYLVLICNNKFNDNNGNDYGFFYLDFNNWFNIIEKFKLITNN